VVTATVSPDVVGLVTVGLAVEVLDELTNTIYTAEVTVVADTATTGGDGQLGHKVTVTPADDLPDSLAGSNVRVTLTAASTGTKQLVVPLAAVSSAADGTTRVSTLDPATNKPIEIPITAGLSADGVVAIEPTDPSALTADSNVIVGR
jgi:DNA-binding beta-propeller fold protein YncE